MKFLFVVAAICVAQPAMAFDRMLLGDCQATFERLSDLVAPDDAKNLIRLRSIDATFDGWCKIDGAAPGFENAKFETLIWRTEDTSRWIIEEIPPLALQLRITGLDPDTMQGSRTTNRPIVNVDATLRQNPDAGQLIVESLAMSNEAGDNATFSGVFDRVFLSSPSMMQVSLGSAVFKAGLVSVTLDGTYENPFGANLTATVNGEEQVRDEQIFGWISKMPEGVIDDASRAELMAFARGIPGPVGTLEVIIGSERGLGLMQVGMSIFQSIETFDVDDWDCALDLMLDGLTVSAGWSPRDGQID